MLDRRKFLVTAAAALAGGGVRGGAPKVSGTPDLVLFRFVRDGPVVKLKVIGWFAQWPGDRVFALWEGGLVEEWRVSGVPYVNEDGVATVPIDGCREIGRMGPKDYLCYDSFRAELSVNRRGTADEARRMDAVEGALQRRGAGPG